jgi:hypothetical protein
MHTKDGGLTNTTQASEEFHGTTPVAALTGYGTAKSIACMKSIYIYLSQHISQLPDLGRNFFVVCGTRLLCLQGSPQRGQAGLQRGSAVLQRHTAVALRPSHAETTEAKKKTY